jgi:4-amino-4-deoxy-L-arabinose transferase-like glycosyltransferase
VTVLRLNRAFVPGLLGILGLAALLRLWQINLRPGYDWDEPVYTSVGTNLAEHGLLQATIEAGRQAEPYLYHPPFYFYLLSVWFKLWGSGITQARVLAAVGSLILLLLVALFLRRLVGRGAALLAAAALALDGWMVFSNRVSWIENTMLPLGVGALWLYWEAYKRGRTGWFVAAGLALGAVTIYKHVGVYFLGAAVLHWLLMRRYHREHVKLLGSAALVVAAYIGGMSLVFGADFWRESTVQFARSLDLRQSRGALNSIADIIGPLLDQYTIFWLTLTFVAISAVFAIVRTVQMLKRRTVAPLHGRELLFAWFAGALIFFTVLQLRLPHYFMMLVVPAYCYLASELVHVVRERRVRQRPIGTEHVRQQRLLRTASVVGCVLLVVWSLTVFWLRIGSREDNALEQTATWVTSNLPANALIITEESVGTTIGRPYCKMYRTTSCPGAGYLITYESHTQQPPDDPIIHRIMANNPVLAQFSGFKEHITVYRIVGVATGAPASR